MTPDSRCAHVYKDGRVCGQSRAAIGHNPWPQCDEFCQCHAFVDPQVPEGEKVDELKPCPFCGSSDVSISTGCLGDTDHECPLVECISCAAMTEMCLTEAEAIAAWNRRAPESVQPDGGLHALLIEYFARVPSVFKHACEVAKVALINHAVPEDASMLLGAAVSREIESLNALEARILVAASPTIAAVASSSVPVAGERERIVREINAYGLAVMLNALDTSRRIPPDAVEVTDRILALRADGSYEYLVRLLATIAPNVQPLPSMLGVCTQIDNAVAGLRSDGLLEKLNAMTTLCVECGPNVSVDEDGCCVTCGATATGGWLTELRSMEETA